MSAGRSLTAKWDLAAAPSAGPGPATSSSNGTPSKHQQQVQPTSAALTPVARSLTARFTKAPNSIPVTPETSLLSVQQVTSLAGPGQAPASTVTDASSAAAQREPSPPRQAPEAAIISIAVAGRSESVAEQAAYLEGGQEAAYKGIASSKLEVVQTAEVGAFASRAKNTPKGALLSNQEPESGPEVAESLESEGKEANAEERSSRFHIGVEDEGSESTEDPSPIATDDRCIAAASLVSATAGTKSEGTETELDAASHSEQEQDEHLVAKQVAQETPGNQPGSSSQVNNPAIVHTINRRPEALSFSVASKAQGYPPISPTSNAQSTAAEAFYSPQTQEVPLVDSAEASPVNATGKLPDSISSISSSAPVYTALASPRDSASEQQESSLPVELKDEDAFSVDSHFSTSSSAVSIFSSAASSGAKHSLGFSLDAGDKPTLGGSGAVFEDFPKPLFPTRSAADASARAKAPNVADSRQEAESGPTADGSEVKEGESQQQQDLEEEGISDEHSDAGTEVGTIDSFESSRDYEDPFALPAPSSKAASNASGPTILRLFEHEYVSPNVDYVNKKQTSFTLVVPRSNIQKPEISSIIGSAGGIGPDLLFSSNSSLSPGQKPPFASVLRRRHRKPSASSARDRVNGFDHLLETAAGAGAGGGSRSAQQAQPQGKDLSQGQEQEQSMESYLMVKGIEEEASENLETEITLLKAPSSDANPGSGRATPTLPKLALPAGDTSLSSPKMSSNYSGSDVSEWQSSTEAVLRASMSSPPPPARPPRHAARPPIVIDDSHSPQGSMISLIKGDGATPEPSESNYSDDGSEDESEIWRGTNVSTDKSPLTPAGKGGNQEAEDDREAEQQRMELAAWEAAIVRQTEEVNRHKEEVRKRHPSVVWADQVDSSGGVGSIKKRTASSSLDFNPMAALPQQQVTARSTLDALKSNGGMPKPIICGLPASSSGGFRLSIATLETPSEDFNPRAKNPILLSSPIASLPSQSPSNDYARNADLSKERLESAIALLPPRPNGKPPLSEPLTAAPMMTSGSFSGTDELKSITPTEGKGQKRRSGMIDYSAKRTSARRQAIAEDEEDAEEAVLSLGLSTESVETSAYVSDTPEVQHQPSLRRQSSLSNANSPPLDSELSNRNSVISLSNTGVLNSFTRRTSLLLNTPPPNEPLPPRPHSTQFSPKPILLGFEERATSPPPHAQETARPASPPTSYTTSYTPTSNRRHSSSDSPAGMPKMSIAMPMLVADSPTVYPTISPEFVGGPRSPSPRPFQTLQSISGMRDSSAGSIRSAQSVASKEHARVGSPSLRSVKSKDSAPSHPKATKTSILASISGASKVLAGKTGVEPLTRSKSKRTRHQGSVSYAFNALHRSPADHTRPIPSRTLTIAASRREQMANMFDSLAESSAMSSAGSTGTATTPPALADQPPSYPTKRPQSADVTSSFANGLAEWSQSLPALADVLAETSRTLSIASMDPAGIISNRTIPIEKAQLPALRSQSDSDISQGTACRTRRGFVKEEDISIETIPEEAPEVDITPSKLKTLRLRKAELDEWVKTSTWDDLLIIRYLHAFGKDLKRVKAIKVLDPAEIKGSAFPAADEWKHIKPNGTVPFIRMGYYLASLTAFATTIFSSTPVRLDRPDTEPSATASLESERVVQRDGTDTHERLYITAFPIYRGIVGGICDLSMWKSKKRTFVVMSHPPFAMSRPTSYCGDFNSCRTPQLLCRCSGSSRCATTHLLQSSFDTRCSQGRIDSCSPNKLRCCQRASRLNL
ncbi:hypothetical protein K437DRAFT_18513 [Tilletiaria anomala UBC 951]|uniref:Uncharacterized protein n=1 Tax=Tilletiaria anomala (strain ATCC 24038 / CBS 436.72 / UBC 951) TaxID=1037660 RepID=A0A066VJT0_TILAU|nr:uncharacterized protein K437DRAFT_18513 [Tilletiaria anomala UBC 951]KDN39004.1 hypothetical protein K437DRAFT_18513 [Tilletiaria anomala UBC 951]